MNKSEKSLATGVKTLHLSGDRKTNAGQGAEVDTPYIQSSQRVFHVTDLT